jgi:hypothetical protein
MSIALQGMKASVQLMKEAGTSPVENSVDAHNNGLQRALRYQNTI